MSEPDLPNFDTEKLDPDTIRWTTTAAFVAGVRKSGDKQMLMLHVAELNEDWLVFVMVTEGGSLEAAANAQKRVIHQTKSLTDALATAERYAKEWLAT